MVITKGFKVMVPGSTSNLGPGFDSIGLAINRFLYLQVEHAEQEEVVIHGTEYQRLKGEGNLILQVMRYAFQQAGQKMPPLRLEISGEIPLQRGLGSSGAAIVAGLVAVNHMLDEVWSEKELLHMAVRLEGHLENVGASLLGGVVIGSWDGQEVHLVQAPIPSLDIVAAIPQQPLPTHKSRAVLPEKISHSDAVFSSSRANLLIAALYSKRWDLLQVGMEDRFHQPYRFSLVPGLKDMLEQAYQHGALGIALSGAGPTVIAFTESPKKLADYMSDFFREHRFPVEIVNLCPWPEGANVQLTETENKCKVIGNAQGDGCDKHEGGLSRP